MKKLVILPFLLIMHFSFAQKKPKPWSASIKSGLTLYSGNVNKFNLKGGANVVHTDSSFEYSFYANGNYAEKDHRANKQEYSVGMKYDYRPYQKFSPFALAEAFSNKQKEIKLRTSGLIGIKYEFYKTDNSQFSFSAAIQNDYDTYFKSDNLEETQKSDKNIVRVSLRPKFKQQITKDLYLEHYTFYQPSIFSLKDYRFYSKTSLSNRLWKIFFIDISYIYEFDNITVYNAIKKEDHSFFVTFVIKL